MDYQIEWGGDPEDVHVTTSGDASVADLDAMVQEGLTDPRFRDGMKILIDHSQTRWWALSNDDLRRRADLVIEDADALGHQKIAFVVGSEMDIGVTRRLQAFVAEIEQLELEIFASLEAARDWLS
jgi:hypothetical protein